MTCAIIVAAGASSRMGFDKLSADLCGMPVIVRTVRTVAACPDVDRIVLVAAPSRLDEFGQWAKAAAGAKLVAVVPGGLERHLSVSAGCQAVPARCDWVAVHDGARPLVSAVDFSAVIARARETGAAALAHPVVETLKRADAAGRVTSPLDRAGVWAMETPQVMRTELLERACAAAQRSGESPTDEVTALEAIGQPVALVASTGFNPKITHRVDLDRAARFVDS